MELSKRLKWILNKTEKCQTIIDVGTDHGYIPIELIKSGICNRAIATDINKDPLNKARINACLDNVDNFIDLRLGGGLSTVRANEGDEVIIAGMGGNLIRDILEADLKKVKLFDFLILQPAQNPEVLRKYLYTHDYEIIEEDICFDEEKYYELFKVRYKKDAKKSCDELFYEISPYMLKQNNVVFKEYLISKIKKNEKIMNFIQDESESAKNRKNDLINKNNRIKELLENL